MTAHIEHETTPLKARSIHNAHNRQRVFSNLFVLYLSHHICRQHFLNTLESIVETCCAVGSYCNAVGSDVKSITLVAEFLVTLVTTHGDKCIILISNRDTVTAYFGKQFAEFLGFSNHFIVNVYCSNSKLFWKNQLAVANCHLHRHRS